jgi:hypothetical protein
MTTIKWAVSLCFKMLVIRDKRDDGISEIDYEILQITQQKASKSEQGKPIHPDLNIYSMNA